MKMRVNYFLLDAQLYIPLLEAKNGKRMKKEKMKKNEKMQLVSSLLNVPREILSRWKMNTN